MLLVIPDLLSPEQTRQCRDALARADWVDGRGTAGHAALKAKHNLQLAADHPLARQLGDLILEALTARDAERAGRALRGHVRNGLEGLVASLKAKQQAL